MLDTALFVAVLALLDPSDATGYPIHEWVGLGFIALFALHVAVSWKWIGATWRRLRENPGPRAARLERRRAARAARHPTFVSVMLGTAAQLFWIAAAGVIGRRLFKLRL
ncbi:MAG: hypothetical protein ABI205_04470 [Gemmatimonadaceae bacterium]